MQNVLVSIVCNTYNHEKYIRKALEGIINQKTSFPIEVLVHDDASTDNTVEIIREFEEKYPDIILPIYEEENQFSKGNGIIARLQYGRAKGKYIAICEGDDYWIDDYKLQKQYNALEEYPQIDVCATSAKLEKDGAINRNIAPSDKFVIFTPNEVISGGGAFVATATLMFRSNILIEMPRFRQVLNIDYSYQIHGALRGGMLYLPEETAVYRFSTESSWTKQNIENLKFREKNIKKILEMLKVLNEDTNYKYNRAIANRINSYRFSLLKIRLVSSFPQFVHLYYSLRNNKHVKL